MTRGSTALATASPRIDGELSAMDSAEEEFENLAHWLVADVTLQTPLHEVEGDFAIKGRELLRQMLQGHLRARGSGDVGDGLVFRSYDRSGNPEETTFERGRVHTRSLSTLFGPITVWRQAYSAPAQESLHPLEAMLPFPRRSFSYEFQRRFVKMAAQGPLHEAIATMKEFTGVGIGKGTAETLIAEAAIDFDNFYATKKAAASSETGSILVAEADGKGVPMIKPPGTNKPVRRKKGDKSNKKKMATLGAVYTKQPYFRTAEEVTESLFRERRALQDVSSESDSAKKKKADKPENKRIWASISKSKNELIGEICEECERRDPQGEKDRVALTDGEIALQSRMRSFLPGFLLILDFIHVLQRLWNAAHAFYGEGAPEAEDWVKTRVLKLLQGQVIEVVRGMKISATKRNLRGSARNAIDKSAAYLYRNRHLMAYDDYLARGFPIATGNIEGAAKNLVKDRMERSGMRWSEQGAEAMLQLRAVYLSGDFESYWKFHIAKEQDRCYPRGMADLMSEN
jgi:hypothetical protein